MKCLRHPSAECLPRQQLCFLCQDYRDNYSVESDRNKFEREIMSQHIQPGIAGIRTRVQYQKFLRRNGLTDDVTTKEIMRATTDRAKRERVKEEGIRRIVTEVGDRLLPIVNRPMQITTDRQQRLKQRLERYLSR